MKDMGGVDVILGIKTIRDDSRIKLSQSHYIEKVLNRFSMLDMTPISSLIELGMEFSKHTAQPILQLKHLKII